jgi:hypothetical protein
MTDVSGEPALLDEPVWYEPLRGPSWLMPPLRDDAIRIAFAPPSAPSGETAPARSVRVGLPLYLAEAVRFSSNARTVAVTGPWAETARAAAVVTHALDDSGGSRRLTVQVRDPSGERVGEVVHEVPDETAFASALAGLSSQVLGVLREAGVRAVWSTVFTPPAPPVAIRYVRAHRLCSWLRDPDVHDPVYGNPDATASKAAAVNASLAELADTAARTKSPLAVALFFAGLVTAKENGSPSFGEFRLQANALCTSATDTRDPVFRLAVVPLSLYGERDAVARRIEELSGEAEVAAWLARVRTVG